MLEYLVLKKPALDAKTCLENGTFDRSQSSSGQASQPNVKPQKLGSQMLRLQWGAAPFPCKLTWMALEIVHMKVSCI